jgi:hypothetical protein
VKSCKREVARMILKVTAKHGKGIEIIAIWLIAATVTLLATGTTDYAITGATSATVVQIFR